MSYNKAYHRFFEDYTEKVVYDAGTGKTKIKRVYAGDYFINILPDEELKKVKIQYGFTAALTVTGMVFSGAVPSATVWYTTVPCLLSLIAGVWMAFYTVLYIIAPKRMEKRNYRDRETLISAVMGCFFALILMTIGHLAWCLVYKSFPVLTLVSVAVNIVAAVLLFLMFRKESDMEYHKQKNDKDADPDSFDIKYYDNKQNED